MGFLDADLIFRRISNTDLLHILLYHSSSYLFNHTLLSSDSEHKKLVICYQLLTLMSSHTKFQEETEEDEWLCLLASSWPLQPMTTRKV